MKDTVDNQQKVPCEPNTLLYQDNHTYIYIHDRYVLKHLTINIHCICCTPIS